MQKHYLILSFLMAITFNSAFSQLKTFRKYISNHWENGDIQASTKIKTIKNINPELFNNYKKTTVTNMRFYKGNKVEYKERYITKIGESGRPCYKIKYSRTDYYENGKKCFYYFSRCDGRKEKTIHYNEAGKPLFKHTVKRNF
jgi:Tfp pilus assembly protein PilE